MESTMLLVNIFSILAPGVIPASSQKYMNSIVCEAELFSMLFVFQKGKMEKIVTLVN